VNGRGNSGILSVMPQFKAGDVVRLKSGGPKMTISSVEAARIFTTWFAGDDPKTGAFATDTLETVEKSQQSEPLRSSGGEWS
jgi:uncharacterized protein YodC (DUF2158 family)